MRRTYDRERYLRPGRPAQERYRRPRDRHGPHRRLPGRDRCRLRGDAVPRRGGAVRQRLHVHLLAAGRDRGGRSLPDQVPDDVKHDRLERLVERSKRAHERNARTDRTGRGGARRGPEQDRSGAASAGAPGATRRSTSRARQQPASSWTSPSRRPPRPRSRTRGVAGRGLTQRSQCTLSARSVNHRTRIRRYARRRVVGWGAPRDDDRLCGTRSSRSSARPRPASPPSHTSSRPGFAPRSSPPMRSRSTRGCRSLPTSRRPRRD